MFEHEGVEVIKERKIGDDKFYLVAGSWSGSRAWGHECSLYWGNDSIVQTTRIRYYNRTWESWQYQSVMIRCLEDYIQKKTEWHEHYFKEHNGIKRMTERKRAEFKKWFKEQKSCYILDRLRKWVKELEK